jgi:hypothetical protein
MFSFFSSNPSTAAADTTHLATAVTNAPTQSFSDLVVPSVERLIDPSVSPIAVAKDLAHAAGQSAGAVAADVAVPDSIETVARFFGADSLLASYGPGRAASAITGPLFEKLTTTPILKGCMAVIGKYSSLLSLAVSGITALQVGVVAAAGLAAGYALYKYFTGRAQAAPSRVQPSNDEPQLQPAIA